MATPGPGDIELERRGDEMALHLGPGGDAVLLDEREALHVATVLRALARDELPPRPRWLGNGPPGELPPRAGRPGLVVTLDDEHRDHLLVEVVDPEGWPSRSRRLIAADALELADRLDAAAAQ